MNSIFRLEACSVSPMNTPKKFNQNAKNAWYPAARAYRFDGPKLAVDCGFLGDLSPRGLQLTVLQLKYLVSQNRDFRSPWPMHFVNFDQNNQSLLAAEDKHLGILHSKNSIGAVVSSSSLAENFDRNRVVYLSPDADEELESVEDGHVYVLGGIVDRVVERKIPRKASFEAASSAGVRSARLPIDKFIEFKSGSKFLTLTAVHAILHHVHLTGNWEEAFEKYIPIRNKKESAEKNQHARSKHIMIREFNHRVQQIVAEKLGEEPK
ncbi:unnamed protein product [Caenorhabditis auriculariae]|uniref:RNA (guanine-9-)-methyltransferase domain-containing protein 1 n=1 Tax=Caenorhabditis auriculariae TaxID=2777116 RepID=A0A8S1HTM5_9PELO|nr:unnamed protein product [Caenorhabditis auriculariae]